MIIYPAIDIMDGKCVRLYQGRADKVTVYADEPADMALRWQSEGAEFLHLVDLNGAFEGSLRNLAAVENIVNAVNIPVQLGGGLRTLEDLDKVFSVGISRAILGTSVITNPELVKAACSKYPGKIVAGIDARDGRVSIKGWVEDTDIFASDLAMQLELYGISRIVYTDILSDGTQKGVNIFATEELAENINIPVIASGGVSTISDIHQLKPLQASGVEGVIIGRALYEGKFTLAEAIEAARWDHANR
ncbi:MAG: 1-(5-phosphoribosyl)-5-[(5-phosphoribosylamino)methylideneamino]imidazole-4-carboxamide isomerase [Firmicutes bacterium]|nr:1-(5-phosphoribosyl)-5-[(5-phosphoribosylamino)methylideneamino]imidazole-4-carboxamide isomerase [Bacillota bacterium]